MAETKLSEIDVKDMVPTKIEIVVAVNDSKKRNSLADRRSN